MRPDQERILTRADRTVLACVTLFCALVALLCSCSGCNPLTADVPGHREVPSVERLDRGSGGSFCTAWRADYDLAVTAGHCCTDPTMTYAASVGRGAVPGAAATIVVFDKDTDVCVLQTNMLGEPLALARQDPYPGDPVWTCGWPAGVFVISSGYWSGRDTDGEGAASLVTAPGESGSPVLDGSGAVVGIVTSMPRISYGGSAVLVTGISHVAPIESVRAELTLARSKLGR